MDDFFARWWDAPNPWEVAMEHTLWLITVIGALWGAYWAVNKQLKIHRENVAARVRREDALNIVVAQVATTNGGSTLLDKVNEGNKLTRSVQDDLASHISESQTAFAANDAAHRLLQERHDAITLRVDGLYEAFGSRGMTTPRRAAERHLHRSNAVDADEDNVDVDSVD